LLAQTIVVIMTARIYLEKVQAHGWKARTTVYLGLHLEGRALVLDILSSKPKEGGIASSATVHRMDAKGGLEHHVGHDYCKLVMYDPKARCTQRNVQEQHAGVLKILDLLLTEALAMYSLDPTAQGRNTNVNLPIDPATKL
jgi:hypothetical protein